MKSSMRALGVSTAAVLTIATRAVVADPTVPQFPIMAIPVSTSVAAEEPPAPEVSAAVVPVNKREYGERYVREIGASAGFMIAPKFHSVTVAPSFGWYLADNVQLSTILSLTSIKAGADTSTIATATLEPSYHLRLDARTFAFAGMGFGYSYIRELGHGLTYTIRIGSQFLVGRKGLFVPSVSYDFRSNKQETESLAAIASERALRLNIGYLSMF